MAELRMPLAADGAVLGAMPLGRRMAALYRCWSQRAPDLAGLASHYLRRLGDIGSPMGEAGLRVAAAVGRWGGSPYHSALHHAEVATNAAVLLQLDARLGPGLAPQASTMLIAAALAHDFQYDAQQAKPRFAAEAASAAAMDAIAAACGVAAQDRLDLHTLILATEPGTRAMLAALVEDGSAALPDPLGPLQGRPDLVRLAAILSDADLLSSAGLTVRWHQVQLGRLERELGAPITPQADQAFLDGIVGPRFLSPGGRHFAPNLHQVRAAVAAACA